MKMFSYPYFVLILVPFHMMSTITALQYWRQQLAKNKTTCISRTQHQPVLCLRDSMAAAEWLALQSCCDGAMLQAQKAALMADQKCQKSNSRSHSAAILLTPRCTWPRINTLTHKHHSHANGDCNPNPSLLSTAGGMEEGQVCAQDRP